MPDSVGPGKRKRLISKTSSKVDMESSTDQDPSMNTRSKTLAGVSQNAVNQLLHRGHRLNDSSSFNVGPCGAQAELSSENEEGEEGSDVEWEAEEMYVQSKTKGLEIDFNAQSKRKSRSGKTRLTKEEKQRQLEIERVHVLCRFARGLILDKISDNPFLQGLALSHLPDDLLNKKKKRSGPLAVLKVLCGWFNEMFVLETKDCEQNETRSCLSLDMELFHCVKTALDAMRGSIEELNVIFACLLKALNYETRTIHVLDFVDMKKPNQSKKKPKIDDDDEMEQDEKQLDTRLDLRTPRSWCEIWCDAKHHDRWIHIDPFQPQIDKPMEAEDMVNGCFIGYVVGYSNGVVYDVSPRYIHSINRIQSLKANKWWMKLLTPFHPQNDPRMELEEAEFEKRIKKEVQIPPKTIDGFNKSHTFILERQITKFKALVPSAKIMGEHRGEPFYLRSDVEELHSVVKWPQQGRSVKTEEIPYPWKIVKKRIQKKIIKNDELVRPSEEEEEKTELYGYWQTEPWKCAVAENGIVPKNQFGNVEIPPMVKSLPENTTYLTYPNLAPICRKLGIDFAPALVGFELLKHGRQVPRIQGIVICSEFENQVVEAYWEREKAREEALEKERSQYAINGWRALLSVVHANIKLHLRYKKKPNE
eukprot:g7616.t1